MKNKKTPSSEKGKEVQETNFAMPNYPDMISERTLELLRVVFIIP